MKKLSKKARKQIAIENAKKHNKIIDDAKTFIETKNNKDYVLTIGNKRYTTDLMYHFEKLVEAYRNNDNDKLTIHGSIAIAILTVSVFDRKIDPNKKHALQTGDLSDSGFDSVLEARRKAIYWQVCSNLNMYYLNNIDEKMQIKRHTNSDGTEDYVKNKFSENDALADKLLFNKTLDDCMDFINDGWVELLKQLKQYGNINIDDLSKWAGIEISVTKPKKRIFANLDKPINIEYVERKTTPRQQIQNYISRCVDNRKAVKGSKTKIIYIDSMVETDKHSNYNPDNSDDKCFYRLPKTSNLFGYVGAFGETADLDAMERVRKYIASKNFTKTQRKICEICADGVDVIETDNNGFVIDEYHEKYPSNSLIAEKLGISEKTIKNHLNDIRHAVDGTQESNVAIPVLQVKNDIVIAEYASINEASKVSGINKGSIQAVLYGNRFTAGGYRWFLKNV